MIALNLILFFKLAIYISFMRVYFVIEKYFVCVNFYFLNCT